MDDTGRQNLAHRKAERSTGDGKEPPPGPEPPGQHDDGGVEGPDEPRGPPLVERSAQIPHPQCADHSHPDDDQCGHVVPMARGQRGRQPQRHDQGKADRDDARRPGPVDRGDGGSGIDPGEGNTHEEEPDEVLLPPRLKRWRQLRPEITTSSGHHQPDRRAMPGTGEDLSRPADPGQPSNDASVDAQAARTRGQQVESRSGVDDVEAQVTADRPCDGDGPASSVSGHVDQRLFSSGQDRCSGTIGRPRAVAFLHRPPQLKSEPMTDSLNAGSQGAPGAAAAEGSRGATGDERLARKLPRRPSVAVVPRSGRQPQSTQHLVMNESVPQLRLLSPDHRAGDRFPGVPARVQRLLDLCRGSVEETDDPTRDQPRPEDDQAGRHGGHPRIDAPLADRERGAADQPDGNRRARRERKPHDTEGRGHGLQQRRDGQRVAVAPAPHHLRQPRGDGDRDCCSQAPRDASAAVGVPQGPAQRCEGQHEPRLEEQRRICHRIDELQTRDRDDEDTRQSARAAMQPPAEDLMGQDHRAGSAGAPSPGGGR
ncbi:MAG: hypothetical protein BWY91_02426 [bacterium ADurb.BinA028]|nr:MAG: hypothetical protein BWY91_02426 [bacterium ADurb.BinA028]